MMKSILPALVLIALALQLISCSKGKQALDTWVHADKGSYSAAISDDGTLLVAGELGGFARVWDLQKNRVKYSLQHENGGAGGVVAADFSASGDILVTIEQESIARWAVADGHLTGYWTWPKLTDVAISADGRYALIGSKDNQAVYFDLVQGKMVYVFPHHEKITSVALSRDGRYALTGSDDWHASLWDLKTGEHLWSKNMQYKISLVALSDDGRYALTNAYIGDVKIFETRGDGKLVSRLDDSRMTLVSADFSDDSRILATGRAARSIATWDVATGKRLESWVPKVRHRVQPDSATILDLKIVDGDKMLISESSTGIGQRWALK